ncbi:LacI family DNA-binding transcriptional regulator [Paraburkholderia acidisoli]|uniref:Substrate-binding domain-containing protein n=1 Tax=Paraburkholderia acidisoli TaxID=2571748 RepID=A0A7Z2GRI9_9BURK|nr:LacI family DNA-binding transcriptional regulator [Paraburkholderia acidisoli]QGZ66582.1 substrate-binding domain-containing protein [Paraburkholderia acidisoli]
MSAEIPPRWRKRSARFVEIAALAGVSTATVDRVLNERGSVSVATRERVVAAARELAVPRQLPDTKHGLIHIDVALPESGVPFFARLREALQRATQMLDRRVVVHRLPISAADEARVTAALDAPPYRRGALIVTTQDTPAVRAALAAAIARGETVVTMVTDIGGLAHRHYAGIDNARAGATAAYWIGRLAREPGRVLVLPSRLDYRAHVERVEGCRAQLARRFASLAFECAGDETRDEDDRAFRAVMAALKRGPLAGLYNTGYGSAGVAAALRKHGAAGRTVWIGHEMVDLHREYIEAGIMDVAIDQDPDGQVIAALQHALHACGVVAEAPPAEPVEFRVFCPANVRLTRYLRE